MPQINGFDLEEEIKKIDQKVKVCFLIAGEIPGKLRSNQFIAEGEGYEDKFIQIPIENNNLIRHVAILIDSWTVSYNVAFTGLKDYARK